MYTARRLGPPKFSKVRSEMHSQLLYSFGLCLFGAGCSIAPPPSLTKLAVIVLLVSPLCRAILRLGSSLFSSLCSPVSWKSFKICLNVIGHVSIGWDMNDGANGMVRPLYATWHRNGAFLQRTCSIQTAQWIEALESLAAGSHHQLWWICWGPEGLEPKSEQQKLSVEIRARMSGTSLQLQPSSTLHFSGASFYMDFWLALIYIQICLRSTPFYRTMEDLSYISIYDYIYPLGETSSNLFVGGGRANKRWTYLDMMKHVFSVFQCVLHIRICSTHIVLTHQWSFSDTRMQEPPMRSSLFHFLQKLSRRSFGGIPQMWPQGMGVNSAAAMKGSRDVMGIMNNDIIRQLTTTGPAKTIKHMQDAVVMSSDESVELVSSNLM